MRQIHLATSVVQAMLCAVRARDDAPLSHSNVKSGYHKNRAKNSAGKAKKALKDAV